jgi:hypothetical protein
MKLKEVVAHVSKFLITANSLKHLTQGEVGEAERLACELALQPSCLRGYVASQVVDPHGGVNNDHQ